MRVIVYTNGVQQLLVNCWCCWLI